MKQPVGQVEPAISTVEVKELNLKNTHVYFVLLIPLEFEKHISNILTKINI